MAKVSNAERCRQYRLRKKAQKEAAGRALARAVSASAKVDAAEQRRAVAKARYAAMKKAGGAEYQKMLKAARARAAAYHQRQRAAKKAAAKEARRG
jgi:hypothetical protein